ncbi:MAG: MaoC family dehydratase [Alphaproteobacteria bacterium]|jgi:acyl dehydratase|nr:MaoC family dehydratase [Alphaproteobacteria bacterium]
MQSLGFQYAERRFAIARAYQEEKLSCCDIDPALYGDRVDATLLGFQVIQAMLDSGVELTGQVHVSQRIRQRSPVALGETLTQTGRITAIETVDRGDLIHAAFDYTTPAGDVAVVVERSSLRPSAAADGLAPPKRTPSPPVERPAGFRVLGEKQLQPELVAHYSAEAGNLIHSDPDVAREHGLRAPIAAGLMGIHFLIEALSTPAPSDAFDVEIRFRRPMFWDDRLTVLGREAAGRLVELRIENEQAKATSVATVHQLAAAGVGSVA